MNNRPRKDVFTRREALALVAGSATAVVAAASSATALASPVDLEDPRAPLSPLADEPAAPFVLSF